MTKVASTAAAAAAAAAVLALAACGVDSGAPEPQQTTWYQHVGPIVAQRCAGCHQAGGIAPFSLTSYEDAAPRAPQLLDAVTRGVMPPWDARETADCTPRHGWKDDPRLAPAELDS